jgi:hypothetical protein
VVTVVFVVVVMPVLMAMSVVVIVTVPVAGELKQSEPEARGDQHAADDRVLRALDRRAELKPDRDDDRTEYQRDENVRDASQA